MRTKNVKNNFREVEESVTRCLRSNLESKNICSEINGSKNAYEIEHTQIIASLLEIMINESVIDDAFNIGQFVTVSFFHIPLVKYILFLVFLVRRLSLTFLGNKSAKRCS